MFVARPEPPVAIPAARPSVLEMRERLWAFVHEECIPAEESVEAFLSAAGHPGEATRFAVVPPVIEALKERARDLGLWNVWADEHMCHLAAGRATDDAGPCGVSLRRDIEAQLPAEPLTVSEYALLAEIMGRSELAALACNCSAPDTGNMELLSRFATPGQACRWLLPLLQGRMRSAFLMTEPDVASSDARNIACAIAVSDDGARATVSGRKWWATGACHPQCGLFLVLGVSDAGARPTRRHSIALVPASAPGVRDVTPLLVFGYDDAPAGHASVTLDACEVGSGAPPAPSQPVPEWASREDGFSACAPLLGGQEGVGRGMLMAQARLGPGRIHHCMRAVGLAERCLEAAVRRAAGRRAFGKPLLAHGATQRDVAQSRMDLQAARALVMHAAAVLDEEAAALARRAAGGDAAAAVLGGAALSARGRAAVSGIKVFVPRVALAVMDRAIQVHGGAGVEGRGLLARAYAGMRCLRIADGPDDVHERTLAGLEARRVLGAAGAREAVTGRRPAKL